VERDLTASIVSYAETIKKAIYSGCDLTDYRADLTNPSSCKKNTSIPVCNYFATSSFGKNFGQELTSNNLQQSCGNWMTPSTAVGNGKCQIIASNFGTLEQSYYQGNMVHSLDVHLAQIKNEIASGKLKLTTVSGDEKAADLYKTQISHVKDMKKILLDYKNIGSIEDCTVSATDSSSAGQQSACMMLTHRKILEQHFAHLAAKELMDRARRSFERFDAGQSGRSFFLEFRAFLNQHQGDPRCRGHKAQCNPNAYMNSCYKPLFKEFFETRTNTVWNTGVCQ
jgi:hypothetical protein